jgi:heme A synthase
MWPFTILDGITGLLALYIGYLFYRNYRASKDINLKVIAIVFFIVFLGEAGSAITVTVGSGAIGAHLREPRLFLLIALAILAWILAPRPGWKGKIKQ